MNRQIRPATSIRGTTGVPGDKSISHRALIFSALASSDAVIGNLAPGQDVRSTARVLAQLGVRIALHQGGTAEVSGAGFDGLEAPIAPLDCGNSGTTMRLMMGVLAGRPFDAELMGDPSLSGRPMARVAGPLRRMGADITLTGSPGHAPVLIRGAKLHAIDYQSPVASAQVKSALLLAGLQCDAETRTTEPALSRDHSERMLWQMGAPLRRDGLRVGIRRGPLTSLGRYSVPGDLSSAAFLLAAGVLLDGPGLRIRGVGVNPTRTGVLEALIAMGAVIDREEAGDDGALAAAPGPAAPHTADPMDIAEPVVTLTGHRSSLRGIELGGARLLRAIDEVPILAVLATQASGRTVISDAAELRVKECDRLAATAIFLNDMGANVQERPDGLVIEGPTPLTGAVVHPHHDHRIAMAAAIAGLVAQGETTIEQPECVAVSFPGFFETLARLAR